MRAQPKITLRTWASRKWDPPPCPRTLQRWVKNANIDPPAEKVGREYYVDPDAKYIDKNGNVTS